MHIRTTFVVYSVAALLVITACTSSTPEASDTQTTGNLVVGSLTSSPSAMSSTSTFSESTPPPTSATTSMSAEVISSQQPDQTAPPQSSAAEAATTPEPAPPIADEQPTDFTVSFPEGPVEIDVHMLNAITPGSDPTNAGIVERAEKCLPLSIAPNDGLILVTATYRNLSANRSGASITAVSDETLAQSAPEQAWLAQVLQQTNSDPAIRALKWLVLINEGEECGADQEGARVSITQNSLAPGDVRDGTYLLILHDWFAIPGNFTVLPEAIAFQFTASTLDDGGTRQTHPPLGQRFVLSDGRGVPCAAGEAC